MMRRYGQIAVLSLLLIHTAPSLGADFLIAESTDFTGNGCENTNLNHVTPTFQSVLEDDGWTGNRHANGDTWPDDFTESCSSSAYGNGNDSSSFFGADRKDLAVYAGHGNSNLLQWGYAHSGRCTARFITECGNPATCNIQRLGSMNGNDAGNAIYATSCTLKQNRLADGANRQWLWQQFGYHNSPAIADDQLSFFYLTLVNVWPFPFFDNNKDAWLWAMEDKPGTSADNSPIVVSYGATDAEALDVRNNANLRNTLYADVDRPNGPSCGQAPPPFFFRFVMMDNGTSSVCS